jgi:hypothetical protein
MPTPCLVCGKPAGTGGDRYKSRPAKYCSYVCRSLANGRKKRGVPKHVQEIERLRALLDAHGIDWREGALSEIRTTAEGVPDAAAHG